MLDREASPIRRCRLNLRHVGRECQRSRGRQHVRARSAGGVWL